jgi:hypothetical protein
VRNRFIAAVGGLLILQVLLFGLVWGSPQLKLVRSYTATPSATPRPPEPTPAGPTPIPTLIPVEKGAPTRQLDKAASGVKCNIVALDLIGAWVKSGKPETAPFEFTSVEGKACAGTFASDVQPLFTTPNLWFSGAPACVTCHTSDVSEATANMSLGTYAGILAGSHRTDNNTPGDNVLGEANAWEQAKLYFMITTRQMPVGRPADSPEKGPVIQAGSPK